MVSKEIRLLLDDGSLQVEEEALCFHSPVFHALLRNGLMQESKESTKSIQLPGKSVASMARLVKMLQDMPSQDADNHNYSQLIHGFSSPDLAYDHVCSVLALADEYQIQWLIQQCEAYFLDMVPSPETELKAHQGSSSCLESLLNVAQRYCLEDLRCRCVRQLFGQCFGDGMPVDGVRETSALLAKPSSLSIHRIFDLFDEISLRSLLCLLLWGYQKQHFQHRQLWSVFADLPNVVCGGRSHGNSSCHDQCRCHARLTNIVQLHHKLHAGPPLALTGLGADSKGNE